MINKGYRYEYITRLELAKMYDGRDVMKIAIAQIGADFIVFKEGRIELLVEVKSTRNKKFYAKPPERVQIERIKEFAQRHNVQAELWVYKKKGAGIPTKKEISIIYQKQL